MDINTITVAAADVIASSVYNAILPDIQDIKIMIGAIVMFTMAALVVLVWKR